MTITASRSITPPPDQVAFGINVTSTVNIDLAGVLAALTGTGITAGDLGNLYSYQNGASQTSNWQFTLNVPLSKAADNEFVAAVLSDTGPDCGFACAGPNGR